MGRINNIFTNKKTGQQGLVFSKKQYPFLKNRKAKGVKLDLNEEDFIF